MSANGRGGNGSGRPSYSPAASYGQRDFGPAQPGAASAGPIEPGSDEEPAAEAHDPDEYGSGRFAAGRDRGEHHPAEYDQPGHDEPEHDWSRGDRLVPSPAGDGPSGTAAGNDYGHYDGYRDHDDLASPGPGPSIAAARTDARLARDGSGEAGFCS